MLESIITNENKAKLLKAASMYGYKVAIYALVTGTAFASENLHLLSIPPYLTVAIGFGLGQIHGWADTRYKLQDKVAGMFSPTSKKSR